MTGQGHLENTGPSDTGSLAGRFTDTHRDKHTENGPAHADGTGGGGGTQTDTQTDTQTRTLRKRTGHAAHVHTKHDHRARVSGRSHYTGNKETNTSQFAPGGRSHFAKVPRPGSPTVPLCRMPLVRDPGPKPRSTETRTCHAPFSGPGPR